MHMVRAALNFTPDLDNDASSSQCIPHDVLLRSAMQMLSVLCCRSVTRRCTAGPVGALSGFGDQSAVGWFHVHMSERAVL